MCVMRVSPSISFYFISVSLVFPFRQQHAADPKLVKGINWTFSPNTGNTSLRSNLESIYKMEYLQLCDVNGWTVMLPKMRKLALAKGGGPHPAFLQSQFLQSLINFIISDDQVCTTTPLENCTFNYVVSSLSMSWNVVNSAICFSCCGKTCKRRTFLTARKFARPLLLRGNRGLLV